MIIYYIISNLCYTFSSPQSWNCPATFHTPLTVPRRLGGANPDTAKPDSPEILALQDRKKRGRDRRKLSGDLTLSGFINRYFIKPPHSFFPHSIRYASIPRHIAPMIPGFSPSAGATTYCDISFGRLVSGR